MEDTKKKKLRNEYMKKYREKNKEKLTKKQKEYNRKSYLKNRENRIIKQKEYNKLRKEKKILSDKLTLNNYKKKLELILQMEDLEQIKIYIKQFI